MTSTFIKSKWNKIAIESSLLTKQQNHFIRSFFSSVNLTCVMNCCCNTSIPHMRRPNVVARKTSADKCISRQFIKNKNKTFQSCFNKIMPTLQLTLVIKKCTKFSSILYKKFLSKKTQQIALIYWLAAFTPTGLEFSHWCLATVGSFWLLITMNTCLGDYMRQLNNNRCRLSSKFMVFSEQQVTGI